MNPEPLRNKIHENKENAGIFYSEDIKSAIEFCKRYRMNVESEAGIERLKNEQPELYEQWLNLRENTFKTWRNDFYNQLLFDYAFWDVIDLREEDCNKFF